MWFAQNAKNSSDNNNGDKYQILIPWSSREKDFVDEYPYWIEGGINLFNSE